MPIDRDATLAMLRARVSRLEAKGESAGAPETPVPLCREVDAVLPGGGLARGAIHDLVSDEAGSGIAHGFAALLAARAGLTTIWIEDRPGIWPSGAITHGLHPASLVLAAAEGNDGLWVAEEALRCPAIGSVCLVATRPLDLEAGHRLQRAAEAGGTLGLVLTGQEAIRQPSAARTRWRIAAAPVAGGTPHSPGHPIWQLELVFSEGGRPGTWNVTWSAEQRTLEAESGPSRAVAASG